MQGGSSGSGCGAPNSQSICEDVGEDWNVIEHDQIPVLSCVVCMMSMRMLVGSLFRECSECRGHVCDTCARKQDDVGLLDWLNPTKFVCSTCNAKKGWPAARRSTVGFTLAELLSAASLHSAASTTSEQAATSFYTYARATVERLRLLLDCPLSFGDSERELLWRYRNSDGLEELAPKAHWFLLFVEHFGSQAPVRVTLTKEKDRTALQEALSEDLQVAKDVMIGDVEGVLLCAGDQLEKVSEISPDMAPAPLPANASCLKGHLPLEVEFHRDTVGFVLDSAPKINLDSLLAFRALAILSRPLKWPEKVIIAVATLAAAVLDQCDAEWFISFLELNVVVWLCRLPREAAKMIENTFLKKAAANIEVLHSLYWALRQHQPTSPVIKGHALQKLANFKENLVKIIPEEVYKKLQYGRDFYDGLAEGGAASLKFEEPFRCAICHTLDVVDLVDEPVVRMVSKAAPDKFALMVKKADKPVVPVKKDFLFKKEEKDDMVMQQQVTAMVGFMLQLLLLDEQMCEHLSKLDYDEASREKIFQTGHHRIRAIYPNIGVIEMVPKARTLKEIRERWKSVREFFFKAFSNGKNWRRLARNYGISSAIWIVMSFLLGICDRHYENVLVTEDGFFLHIDFGHIFQEPSPAQQQMAPKARVDFKDIESMVGEDDMEKVFFDTLRLVFNILRSKAHLLLEMLYLAAELQPDENKRHDRDSVRAFIEERCQPGSSNKEAGEKIKTIVERNADTVGTKMTDFGHDISQRYNLKGAQEFLTASAHMGGSLIFNAGCRALVLAGGAFLKPQSGVTPQGGRKALEDRSSSVNSATEDPDDIMLI